MNLAALAKFAFPNALTLARLAVGLAFFWLPTEWRLGAVLFAGVTDLVDGWFSRHLHVTSLWGKILDPIADKTCVLAVVFTLLYEGRLKGWELVLVAQRDLVVLAIALAVLLLEHQKLREMPPRISGKIATAGQFVFLLGQVGLESPPRALFVIAVIASGAAGLDYLAVAVVRYKAVRTAREAENTREELS